MLVTSQYSENIVYTISSKITSFFGISNLFNTENVVQPFDAGHFQYSIILLFLSLLIGFVLFRPEKKISEVSKIRSFLSFTLITILFTSAALTPLSIASNYWNSVSADEMNATESVTSPGSTETEPATAVQPTESSNPNEPSTPTSEEPPSADISATTTPVGNSTTTLPAGNSTSPSAEVATTSADNSTSTLPASDSLTTSLADNSTSSSTEESISQTELVPDTSIANEITQPLPDATLSLQFDDSVIQATDVVGDATVDEKLDVTSLNLDGEGDFVQVTDTTSARELTAMSLSAWVNPDYSSGSSEFTVVSKDIAFVLAINNNIPPLKIAKFAVFDGIKWSTVESTTQIKEEWTHLAATFDGSSIGIYVNGNLESTLPLTDIQSISVNGQLQLTPVDSISSDSDIVIGAYLNEKGGNTQVRNQFSGLIDSVRLYDSLLTPDQISEIYNQNTISYTSSAQIDDFGLTHDSIEIGKPVTWTQNVAVSGQTENVAVEVPTDAQIILVTSAGENVDLSTLETTTQAEVFGNELTVASLDLVSEMVQEGKPTEFVVINEVAADYTITFETPAPYTLEEDQSTSKFYSKEVTVVHDSALHYTNVKSYSDIPEDLVAQGIPLKLYWIIDGQRTDVTLDPRFAVQYVDTNGNGIADQMQWVVPQLSEQQFVIEAQLTIINVQSYPVVGEKWTVKFRTVGTADLVITAVNGTTFGESIPNDLKFLTLNNGTHTLAPTIDGNSIIYHSYSSTAEGFATSQVLTAGKHDLEFKFGNDVKHAHNLATAQLMPDSEGPSNLNQWSPGAPNSKVTGVSLNDNAFFIKSTGSDKSQTFGFQGAEIPPGSIINSVTLFADAKKFGTSGITNFELIVGKGISSMSAGTGEVSLTTTDVLYSAVMNENPFTNQAWTISEVNTWITPEEMFLTFGGKTGTAADEARVDQYYLVVNYNEPIAGDDAFSTSEGTPLTIPTSALLSNDFDVDSPTLTVTSVTSGTGGTAVLNGDATITFTPTISSGDATFTYTVSDGTATDIGLVTVTIIPSTIADTLQLQAPELDTAAFNQYTGFGATVGGVLLTDPADLPGFILAETTNDAAIASAITSQPTIALDTSLPAGTLGSDVITSLAVPTYSVPDAPDITVVMPAFATIGTAASNQFVSTPVLDQIVPGQELILTVSQDAVADFGGVSQLSAQADPGATAGTAVEDWIIIELDDELPVGIDTPPLLTPAAGGSFELFVNILTAHEAGIPGAFDWSDPANHATPPIITAFVEKPVADPLTGEFPIPVDAAGCPDVVQAFFLDTTPDPDVWTDAGVIVDQSSIISVDSQLCSVSVQLPHFSKFAIGGIRALLGASLAGGPRSNSPPLVVSATFSRADQPQSADDAIIGFGGKLQPDPFAPLLLSTSTSKGGEPIKPSSTKTINVGDPLTLKLSVQEDEGASAIEHVAFYVNLVGDALLVDKSDTYIIYDKYKPVQIVDPHGFFSEVNLATSYLDVTTLQLTYDIKFAKPMAQSDLIIRSWDVKKNNKDTKILDVLEVVERGALTQDIPSWVKNNANLWSSGQIGDSDFVQGIQYLKKQGIITVPETGSDSSQQIPGWIKNNAEWWAEGLISDDDFIVALQWLITNGIMKV